MFFNFRSCCLPIFPSRQKWVWNMSSMAPLRIFGSTLIIWFLFCSATLLISELDTWSDSSQLINNVSTCIGKVIFVQETAWLRFFFFLLFFFELLLVLSLFFAAAVSYLILIFVSGSIAKNPKGLFLCITIFSDKDLFKIPIQILWCWLLLLLVIAIVSISSYQNFEVKQPLCSLGKVTVTSVSFLTNCMALIVFF